MPVHPVNMPVIASGEARDCFYRLLDRVEGGERIVIARRGMPVAVLIPYSKGRERDLDRVVAELMVFHKGKRRGKYTIRELIEDGRR